ncbi:MAG: hypothetical protein GY879_11415 [Planctomycetes bacterium]|nr:hypothetical protein [Planctomycetota bacterium]
MSSLLRALTLALLLVPLGACGGEETTNVEDGKNAVENAADDATAKATEAADEMAEKICCAGKCPTPAGYCCADDGTCNDSHVKLPLASSL